MIRGVVCMVALGAAITACAGGDGGSTPTTSSAPPTTSTSLVDDQPSEVSEEQAVIDAYLAAIDAFYEAANPPDPHHPALEATHTGDVLASVKESLRELNEQGLALRRGDSSTTNPLVLTLTDKAAIVEDCATDADIQFDRATGEVVDDTSVVGRFTARLVRQAGTWLVAAVEFEELEEPCVSGVSGS